ncbi:kinase-like protein [Rhizophagus irregularis]|uniref:Kinase-like protein n=1 Tax=Rhizophagus irregularis TaxID=588596 RepID=A0A2N1N5L3_9GLOM|nr:kinase-like protein [Rhizophagus irregularis]
MTSSEWIDKKIEEEDINFFRYDEFINLEKVGEGAFGIVNRADWNSGKIKIALKILTNNKAINEINNENNVKSNMEKFIKELKILRKVGFHPNINQFYGITRDPTSNNYVMVLQYANQGNLREYLKINFKPLQWSDKIRMASEIACGLKYLHSTKIIHRDLHAKNILVHNGTLMIADLGLAKELTIDGSSNSVVYGMPAYVEPQCYKYGDYVRDLKSDIYSLGVLLWEITSGYPPFSKNSPHKDTALTFKIANGYREEPIINTPKVYVNLYQRCWDDDPKLRPTVIEVFNILEDQYNNLPKIMEDVIKKNNSDKNSQILYDQNNLKLSYLENPLGESPSFFTPKIYEDERENIINATDEIIDSYLKRNNIGWSRDFSFPKILEKHKSISNKIFGNLINNQTIRQYEVMVGYFYEDGFGVYKNEIVAFEWYKKASKLNNLNGQFELGYCYNYGYSIKKNLKEALKSYKLASDEGLNIATYFLAISYEFDNEKNRFDEAFKLYKKSAEKGFIPSQYKLATFYEIGKGTQQNKTEALKWYKLFLENNGEYDPTYNIKDTIMEKTTLSIKSLINDIEREITRNELDEIIEAYLKHNSIGETKSFSFFKVLKNYESKSLEIFKCLNNNQTIRNYEVIVGKFHEMGFGTNENMDKAFKWYIDASKQNNYNGILETGNCYYNGNGVVKNCDKAFEFFQRAVNESKEKLNRALYSLATCYKSGDGIRKMNETNQQLLREHQVKAFELYKKSAENGFVLSQRELAECYKDGIGTQKNRDEASKWGKKYTTSQNELSKKL